MYTCRLPFLPGSTSALVAVFLAGLTFGFILFPVVIFYYFSFVIIFIFLIFIFIIGLLFLSFFYFMLLFLLFLTSIEVDSGICSSVERLDELDDVFVVLLCSNLSPFASSTCFIRCCSPLSQFLIFSVFSIFSLR